MTSLARMLAEELSATARPPTLEEVLTSPEWFGLETATEVQRNLCKMAQGHHPTDLYWCEDEGKRHGPDIRERCDPEWMLNANMAQPVKSAKPVEVYLLAGIRCGKSLLAAAVAVHASQTIDVSKLRPGERARFSILSLDKDKARAVLMHLYGAVEHSGRVAALVVGEVRADGVDLRHPSGTIVEIRVVAGRRAGGGLVAYWSAGVVFDEAPRMVGEDEGVVNFADSRKAVLGRLLPGAQLWAIGSPWAPMGPVYNTVQEHWGNPGRVLVVRAPAPALNPSYWTPEKCAEVKATDVEAYRMDVLGEWGTPETAMFSDVELAAVMRDGELPPERGEHYFATMDPSGRGGNAWTLVLGALRRATARRKSEVIQQAKRAGEWEDPSARARLAKLPAVSYVRTVYVARQWYPGSAEDGDEDAILGSVAELCRAYGVKHVYSDQYAAGAIISLGQRHGLAIIERPWTAANKLDAFDSLRVAVRGRDIQLVSAPNLREDLLRTRRKLTQSGATIHFPPTADGRHCDYAPAVAMFNDLDLPNPDVTEVKTAAELYEERALAEESGPAPKPGRLAPKMRRYSR